MRVVRKITNNRFVNIREIKDPEMHLDGYQFAERLGVDSVAFVLWDENEEMFLLNREYKPPVDKFMLGAFGGSMDKNKSPEEIVIAEVKEEAGFVVDKKDVYYVGEVLVSTQMNQMCKLYLVKVDKKNQDERDPENPVEAMAETEWVSYNSNLLSYLRDWKPLAIISKAKAIDILS